MPDPNQQNEYARPAGAGLPGGGGQALSAPAASLPPPSVPPSNDAAMQTAGGDQAQLFPAATLDTHPLIAAVVPAVQATTEPANWAMTAATLLQALAPLQSQVFVASRASAKTQTQINLAEIGVVTLAGILQMFFPHPRAG